MKTVTNELQICLKNPPRPTPNGIVATFCCPPNFVGFSGHFPDNPILPGVVQLMMGAFTASMGKETNTQSVKRAKFTRPVKPNEVITVKAVNTGKDALIESVIEMSVDNEPCATFTLFLKNNA